MRKNFLFMCLALFMCIFSFGCGNDVQQKDSNDEKAHPSLGMTYNEFVSQFNKYAKEYSKGYDIDEPIQITNNNTVGDKPTNKRISLAYKTFEVSIAVAMYEERDGGRIYGIHFLSGEKNKGTSTKSDKRKIAASQVGKKALLRTFNPNASQDEIERLINQLNLNESDKTDPVSVNLNGLKFYAEQNILKNTDRTYMLIITPENMKFRNRTIDPILNDDLAKDDTNSDMIKDFIKSKDEYNKEISNIAKDINEYASSHADFKGANDLIARAQNLEEQIKQTLTEVDKLNNADDNVKQKLKECLEYEITRIDGLYIGMKKSQNDGDFLPDFKRGGDAAETFEKANADLTNMIR